MTLWLLVMVPGGVDLEECDPSLGARLHSGVLHGTRSTIAMVVAAEQHQSGSDHGD